MLNPRTLMRRPISLESHKLLPACSQFPPDIQSIIVAHQFLCNKLSGTPSFERFVADCTPIQSPDIGA